MKILYPLLLCLTLGLAPFSPEPHVVKQMRNIASGSFTKPLDWFDLLLHGAPWVWLAVTLTLTLFAYFKRSKAKHP